MSNTWKKIGSVRPSKLKEGETKPSSFYIKLDESVTLGPGDSIQLQDPRKKLKDAVIAGRLSEEKAAEIAAKIPEYIKYEIVLPPKR